ncbi:Ig-like domain-containing protein [Deinococcus misasensis]|uniref:Ig-like domain-containing protein n=1 Tax=Deinococcus misasensis TaxID=392413 RepID=UPI000689F69C|nr:Ig-like domain-containing protein [Deinococcus misasensis]
MTVQARRTAFISLLLITGAVSCGTQTLAPTQNTTKATKQAFSASGYSIDGGTSNAWQGGYSGYLRVANVTASVPIKSFEFTFKFNGTTTMAGSAWNGTVTGPDASGVYTAKSPDWLQYSPISVGGKWDLGFNGNGTFSGITVLAAKINGQPLSSDTIKPTASLSANKTSVTTAPNTIELTATATDNAGVSRVEFYDGTTKLGEDLTAPYTYTYNVQDSSQNGLHPFMARAIDAAGNTGVSAKVNVTISLPVTPPPPTGSQKYRWQNVEIVGGGFVPGIIFNPKEKDLIYARTDIGGAYRWDKTTNRWIQLLNWVGADDWGLSGVDSLATDPVDPNRVYLAVGTYTNDWDPNNGAILRSSDRGQTWQKTDLPFKVGGNMPGRGMGERLAIDPNKNSTLYFGARSGNGLWRSTDYGVTWSQVSAFPNPGNYIPVPGDAYQGDKVGVVWITFDPKSSTSGTASKKIYVGVADKDQSIYQSTDGGVTWSAVAGQPTGFLPHHGELDSEGNLYITYSDGAGPYDGTKGDVWKLNTSTGAWTNVSPVPSSSADLYYGYGGVALDRQKPGTLMVAALNSWWPDTILFRSTDYGKTWSRIWDWNGYPSRSLRYNMDTSGAPWLNFGNTSPVDPEPAVKLGWMVNDLEIDPFNSNRMMYGTGATVYGTDNLTQWDLGGKINLKVLAQGIEETAVLDLISPPEGANLYSALGDIGGFRHDDLGKVPQKMIVAPYAGSHNTLDYAELKPNFMVRAGNPVSGKKSTAFSFDGGLNWNPGNSEPSGIKGAGFITAAADASRVVWAPQGTGVYYSTTQGNSWTLSTGIPNSAQIAADRVNPKTFYGVSGNTFYISTDGGASFKATAGTGLPAEWKNVEIKAVPGKEGHVWLAAGSAGLFQSTNGGQSFSKISGIQTAHVVGFGKAAPGQGYMAVYISGKAGGSNGFFRSDDGGKSWVRINDDLHQFGSTNTAITGDPRVYGRVYIGTNGYGIVYGDIQNN